MAERGSDKHGPRQDDELKHELRGMEQADRPVRAEEWRDPEPPADDDPLPYQGDQAGTMGQTIADVMSGEVVTLPVDASVVDAAMAMRDENVGDVLVDQNGTVRGIVTDRDLVVRALAEGSDLAQTPLGDLCSDDVATVYPNTAVDEAVDLMRGRAVRRLPVVDEDGRPLGIVSLGDVALARQPDSPLAEISDAPPTR